MRIALDLDGRDLEAAETLRALANRKPAPPDTITVDGHEYVRLVLCPRDETGEK